MFLLRTAALLLAASVSTSSLTVPITGADASAVANASNAQTPTMPDGAGRSLVTAQCIGCHTLEMTLGKRATTDEWRTTVQTMVDRGAKITGTDAETIATYLAEHYGPGAPAAASAATSGGPASALPDGPGRDVLTKKCFQCHQISMWSSSRHDRTGWEGVMYRMVGRGALWTEDEIRAMVDYLARVRGPQ
jgi:cytochrome c5